MHLKKKMKKRNLILFHLVSKATFQIFIKFKCIKITKLK